MEKKTMRFVKEKETKNMVRFTEKPAEGQPPVIGTIYINKWAVGAADTILVTIE